MHCAEFNELPSKILAHMPDNARRLKIPDSQVAELTEAQPNKLERVMGIEPTSSAWEAEVLPLNYTRAAG